MLSKSFVYILSCADQSYYVGSTTDLPQRIIKHQRAGVKYTKSRLPVKLVYTEEHEIYSDARKRERRIKSWKKRIAIERLIKGYIVPSSSSPV